MTNHIGVIHNKETNELTEELKLVHRLANLKLRSKTKAFINKIQDKPVAELLRSKSKKSLTFNDYQNEQAVKASGKII